MLNYAELAEFNYVELIIIKWGKYYIVEKFITKQGSTKHFILWSGYLYFEYVSIYVHVRICIHNIVCGYHGKNNYKNKQIIFKTWNNNKKKIGAIF